MAYDVSACFETSLLDPFSAFFLVCAKLHWLKELWVKESVNLPGFHHGTAPEYLLSWWHQGWDHSSGLVFVGWFWFCRNLQRDIHGDVANNFENLYIVIWPLVADIQYTLIYNDIHTFAVQRLRSCSAIFDCRRVPPMIWAENSFQAQHQPIWGDFPYYNHSCQSPDQCSKEVLKSNFRQYGQMKSRAGKRQREEKD